MKVNVLREICIGCGTCVALAEGTFEMQADNKSMVKNQAGNSEEEIINAAKACPVAAIEVFDNEGKKVWPEG
jgi:ferredoxin